MSRGSADPICPYMRTPMTGPIPSACRSVVISIYLTPSLSGDTLCMLCTEQAMQQHISCVSGVILSSLCVGGSVARSQRNDSVGM